MRTAGRCRLLAISGHHDRNVGFVRWSQAVDATRHADARDGVDGRWVEDMFEGSTRWPRRSCGTAGGARSQFNRVARQLNERSRETLGFETRAERDLMLVLHRPIELTTQSGHGLRTKGALVAEGYVSLWVAKTNAQSSPICMNRLPATYAGAQPSA